MKKNLGRKHPVPKSHPQIFSAPAHLYSCA